MISRRHAIVTATVAMLGSFIHTATAAEAHQARARARDLGICVGIMPPGPLNAITDVAGVKVGNWTLHQGRDIHTGVTAVLPHAGNIFQEKVPAAIVVANGFGKLAGSPQVQELGEIETPILLTNTLAVPVAAAATIDWTLRQPGNESVVSVNAVVGETNDSTLNDIRRISVTQAGALQAIAHAREGAVEEGSVGAGAGTRAFGFKGGIGTSSRHLPERFGGYTVGALVQSNYGGVLTIAGVPVGLELDESLRKELSSRKADGSIMVVIATDAPLSDRNLERLARRAQLGIGRTGSSMSNGSGDFIIAFSTSPAVRRTAERRSRASEYLELPNDLMSPLFTAAVEATEEAIYNSMLRAMSIDGHKARVEAIDIDRLLTQLRKYNAVSSSGSCESLR